MFHNVSWKPIYFGSKVISRKIITGMGLCTIVSAGFF